MKTTASEQTTIAVMPNLARLPFRFADDRREQFVRKMHLSALAHGTENRRQQRRSMRKATNLRLATIPIGTVAIFMLFAAG